jgi:hypothetical protein
MYYKTTIYVSFSLYVYLFAKTKLKLILLLYVTFIYNEFIPQPLIKLSGSVPASTRTEIAGDAQPPRHQLR